MDATRHARYCSCSTCWQTGGQSLLYEPALSVKALVCLSTKRDVQTDDARMSASGILCTGIRDRQGDVIEPSGVDCSEHQINPIVLWDHNRQGTLPLGKTEAPDGAYTVFHEAEDDILTQTTFFADHPFARQIYALIRDRVVRANSIAVKDIRIEKIPADPDRGFFRPGKHILESKLAEATWTTLPANPETVASYLHHQRVDDGGFARVPLDEVILKSLLPYAPARKAWTPGLGTKANGTLETEKKGPKPEPEPEGAKPMADVARTDDALTNKAAAHPEVEQAETDDNDAAPADLPPGAKHLHDHHDLLMAHKAMLEEQGKQMEHPDVRDINEAHKDMLHNMAHEVREKFGQIYPDHPAPQEEKSGTGGDYDEDIEADGDRTTPERVGMKAKVSRQDSEGNRVARERKSSKAPSSKFSSKSVMSVADESLFRTWQREQAALFAEQMEVAEMERKAQELGV